MSQFLMHTTAFVNDLAATPLWASLGWTMWYYLWIGLIELAFAGLILSLLRRTSSALRYRFLLGLFALLLVTPVIIFQYAYRETNAPLPNTPVVLTAPTLSWVPSTGLPKQGYVEPDRIPNALQPPWKPEASNPGEILRNSETPLLLVPQSAAPPNSSEIPLSLIGLTNRLATFVPWFPIFWIVGSPLTLLCLAFGLIGAERFRRQARIISAGSIVDQCAQLAPRIGLNGHILIGFSERISSPILIGILKPLILLPITAETGWTPAQLEMVLLHELAHVRRWDNLVNLLQRLAEGILFFQPAVWIVSRWLTAEREHCCDELVVRVTGRAHDYATALAELAMAEHLPPGVVSAMARHPLLGRIRRILGHEQPLQVSRGTLTIALIISLSCCALAGLTHDLENKPTAQVVPENTPLKTASALIADPSSDQPMESGDDSPDTFQKRWQIVDVAGKPIPDVQVVADGLSFQSDNDGWVSGSFSISRKYDLTFTKPGFLPVSLHLNEGRFFRSYRNVTPLALQTKFEMIRCSTLDVTVLDANDKPVPNYRLSVSNRFSTDVLERNSKHFQVLTDERGRAVVINLREGLVSLRTTQGDQSDASRSSWVKTLPIADGSRQSITLSLSDFSSILEGTILSETGSEPAGPTTLRLENRLNLKDELEKLAPESARRIERFLREHRFPVEHSGDEGAILEYCCSTVSERDGRFRIQGLLPGEYSVSIPRLVSMGKNAAIPTSEGQPLMSIGLPSDWKVPNAELVAFDPHPVTLKPHETTQLKIVVKPPVTTPAVKKSPLIHLELTGDSVRVLPEQLRYDGKSFGEWVEVLRTEIKTERIAEAIEVMLYFGSKGYQSEAASEVVAAMRRISPVQEIRERTSSAMILSKALITLNLLGKDSVPYLAEILRDQDDSQVIIGLEFLSRVSTETHNWPDKLPEPTSAWQVVPPSFGENQELLVRFPPWWFSPEIGKELALLLNHPNPEIRARLTPVALRCHTGDELPEVLNESLTDLAPAVWFNSLVFLETYKSLFQVSPNEIRDIFKKLKAEGKFQGDPIRRNLYLKTILKNLSENPTEDTTQYLPDILDDLKATPIDKETAYWHLIELGIPASSEKALAFRDAVRKAATDLPPDQKTRVEETLNALDPEIHRGIKQAEDQKTPKKS